MPVAWHLQRDLASFAGLRLRLHRIGRAHWRADTRLRSWGVAPLHPLDGGLHAPCGEDEALWLGAWLDDDGHTGSVGLHAAADGLDAAIALPQQFQITGLRDRAGREHPLVPSPGGGCRTLQLVLCQGSVRCETVLVLHPPGDWAQLAGRAAPAALVPPPPPPRLG